MKLLDSALRTRLILIYKGLTKFIRMPDLFSYFLQTSW